MYTSLYTHTCIAYTYTCNLYSWKKIWIWRWSGKKIWKNLKEVKGREKCNHSLRSKIKKYTRNIKIKKKKNQSPSAYQTLQHVCYCSHIFPTSLYKHAFPAKSFEEMWPNSDLFFFPKIFEYVSSSWKSWWFMYGSGLKMTVKLQGFSKIHFIEVEGWCGTQDWEQNSGRFLFVQLLPPFPDAQACEHWEPPLSQWESIGGRLDVQVNYFHFTHTIVNVLY